MRLLSIHDFKAKRKRKLTRLSATNELVKIVMVVTIILIK